MEFTASGDNGQGQDTVAPLSGWWVYEKKPEGGREMELGTADSLPGVGHVANSNPLETGASEEEEDGREEQLKVQRMARLQRWAAIEV